MMESRTYELLQCSCQRKNRTLTRGRNHNHNHLLPSSISIRRAPITAIPYSNDIHTSLAATRARTLHPLTESMTARLRGSAQYERAAVAAAIHVISSMIQTEGKGRVKHEYEQQSKAEEKDSNPSYYPASSGWK
jgi:hypothetical protein